MGKGKTLAEDHLRLFTEEFQVDVNFLIEDGEEAQIIRAHKLILASRSPVFSAMFYGELREPDDIKLPDTTGEIFKAFLR